MSAAPIKFASLRQEQEWADPRLNGTVRLITEYAADFCFHEIGHIITLTSIYRTMAEDKALEGHGIHPVWRAVDVRTNDMPVGAALRLEDEISRVWRYDPARPYLQVAYGKPHGTGPHIHLQVSSVTCQIAGCLAWPLPNKMQAS